MNSQMSSRLLDGKRYVVFLIETVILFKPLGTASN